MVVGCKYFCEEDGGMPGNGGLKELFGPEKGRELLLGSGWFPMLSNRGGTCEGELVCLGLPKGGCLGPPHRSEGEHPYRSGGAVKFLGEGL